MKSKRLVQHHVSTSASCKHSEACHVNNERRRTVNAPTMGPTPQQPDGRSPKSTLFQDQKLGLFGLADQEAGFKLSDRPSR